jgi:hypothetical protein
MSQAQIEQYRRDFKGDPHMTITLKAVEACGGDCSLAVKLLEELKKLSPKTPSEMEAIIADVCGTSQKSTSTSAQHEDSRELLNSSSESVSGFDSTTEQQNLSDEIKNQSSVFFGVPTPPGSPKAIQHKKTQRLMIEPREIWQILAVGDLLMKIYIIFQLSSILSQ